MENDRVLDLDEDNFDEQIKSQDGPILVEFWASWYAPCKELSVGLGNVARELQGRVRLARINVDDSGDLVNRFGIRSVPTIVLFNGGRVVDQLVGAVPEERIRELLGKHVTR